MEIPLCLQEETAPEVFISYQWGKQKEISVLYRRLTGLGFTCWMDIHQMGGGDSLYDKIDRGIRGCKVVLTSITQKYALSANCRREVSLADALKKPIIPLLMEKSDWPPSGPMSMVFTQLLFINFCKDETVQLRWDGPKFDELLQQMHMHVPAIENQTSEEKPVSTKPENEDNNINKDKPEEADKIVNAGQKNNSKKQISTTEKAPSLVTDNHEEDQTKPEVKETPESESGGIVMDSKIIESNSKTSNMAHKNNTTEANNSAEKSNKSELQRANNRPPATQTGNDSSLVKQSSYGPTQSSMRQNYSEYKSTGVRNPPPKATYEPSPPQKNQNPPKKSSTCVLL